MFRLCNFVLYCAAGVVLMVFFGVYGVEEVGGWLVVEAGRGESVG